MKNSARELMNELDMTVIYLFILFKSAASDWKIVNRQHDMV